ncbi:protein NipSnap homolog 3A isoform X1 [Dendrobates tinctorius]|uniref:protein NipSnap homolog 3A isoform X1 n=1 Tax=Dendrobates tinctorius TaxID=92724 RepID=UPI003CC9807B
MWHVTAVVVAVSLILALFPAGAFGTVRSPRICAAVAQSWGWRLLYSCTAVTRTLALPWGSVTDRQYPQAVGSPHYSCGHDAVHTADLGLKGESHSERCTDSFAHRSAVRSKLAQDKAWKENYISKALPMMDKQDNEVAYLVPWCKLQKPEKEGVYEMVSFQFKPGGPAVWGKSFRAAISTHVNCGYTKLVGVFNTEYGLLNQVHVLWWNDNSDNRAAGRHVAHEDARVVAAVRESVAFLESQQNFLMVPTPFSPMK